MDAIRFDHWIRTISTISSRRQMLGALLLGATTSRFAGEEATAGTGCKNVGQKCTKAKDCCSGICKGKKGKKKCKAHGAGGCTPGQNACGGDEVDCTTATGVGGVCYTTTGNAGFCGVAGACISCTKDDNCKALFGPLAACVVCSTCAEGTACIGPDQS